MEILSPAPACLECGHYKRPATGGTEIAGAGGKRLQEPKVTEAGLGGT